MYFFSSVSSHRDPAQSSSSSLPARRYHHHHHHAASPSLSFSLFTLQVTFTTSSLFCSLLFLSSFPIFFMFCQFYHSFFPSFSSKSLSHALFLKVYMKWHLPAFLLLEAAKKFLSSGLSRFYVSFRISLEAKYVIS